MIRTEDLTKVYRVPCKEPGLWGSVRGVFRRRFQDVRAVDGVSLRIEPAECVGFLGPNGAGKTTLLKMLAGLLVPTSGSVEVAGFVPSARRPEFLRRITMVMGQKQQLLWDLPARETFELNRALYDLDASDFGRTLSDLVDLLGLGDLLARPVRNLSLGERMKCELAAALLHHPTVLFLDEPTIGLDVSMQAAVRQFIGEWNRRHGATVLLTSHYMADIAALCERVVVIDHGRVRFDGMLADLVRRYAPERRVVVRLLRPLEPEERRRAAPLADDGDGRMSAVVPAERVTAVVGEALAALPLADLHVEEPQLDDVIRHLFASAAGPGAAAPRGAAGEDPAAGPGAGEGTA